MTHDEHSSKTEIDTPLETEAEVEEEEEPEKNVRNYVYGLLPTPEQDIVMAQMLLAHRYRNKLIEIEHWRRHAYETARRELTDDDSTMELNRQVAELDAKIEAMRTTIKGVRKVGKARAEAPELRKEDPRNRHTAKGAACADTGTTARPMCARRRQNRISMGDIAH